MCSAAQHATAPFSLPTQPVLPPLRASCWSKAGISLPSIAEEVAEDVSDVFVG